MKLTILVCVALASAALVGCTQREVPNYAYTCDRIEAGNETPAHIACEPEPANSTGAPR